MHIAVLASIEETEAALSKAFRDEGWEAPSPGKPHQVMLSLHEHRQGCLIKEVWISKSSWHETVGATFARAVVDAGGWVLIVSPGVAESTITEWCTDGSSVRTVSNPVVSGRRVEEREERIAKAQIEALAIDRIGPPTRRRVRRVEFRPRKLPGVSAALAAVDRGDAVSETTVGGRPAFRFPKEGGTQIVVLSEEEAERVRAAVRTVGS